MIKIRALSWNIRHGLTNEGYVDIQAYVEEAKTYEPDIIFLQEVDRGVRRSGKIDQVKFFKEAFGFEWSAMFAPRLGLQGGEYGLATLTRFPIYGSKNHLLSDHHYEKCVLQELEVDVDGRNLSLMNLHMPYDGHTGRHHAEIAWTSLSEMRLPTDLIIGGDLNALPSTPESEILLLECTDIGEKRTTTYGRIDYCMGRGRAVPIEQEVFPSELSDHFPFVTTFLLKPFDTSEYKD
jgi:endonuclease/exonuclease/phosphatase family metal-dependent hydrolase